MQYSSSALYSTLVRIKYSGMYSDLNQWQVDIPPWMMDSGNQRNKVWASGAMRDLTAQRGWRYDETEARRGSGRINH